jgi:hypothetical protein
MFHSPLPPTVPLGPVLHPFPTGKKNRQPYTSVDDVHAIGGVAIADPLLDLH